MLFQSHRDALTRLSGPLNAPNRPADPLDNTQAINDIIEQPKGRTKSTFKSTTAAMFFYMVFIDLAGFKNASLNHLRRFCLLINTEYVTSKLCKKKERGGYLSQVFTLARLETHGIFVTYSK